MPGPASRAMIPPRAAALSGTLRRPPPAPCSCPGRHAVIGMENPREVREPQTHPVEAMCLGDSERDAAAGSGHARADAQRDRLAARTDPLDGGPRPGAVPGVGIEIQERGRSAPEFATVAQPVELVASGASPPASSPRDRDRGCPRAEDRVGGGRQRVAVGAGPGTGWVVEIGDDHGSRVGLDMPADIVADEGERLGHGASTAVAANHGYLDRVVQRASLRATRARNG